MEYRFRGKRKDNNQWTYGSLITDIDQCRIHVYGTGESRQVFPDTVGMWTGLKDKKGIDIYEGDIIEFVGGTTHYLSCGNYASDDYSIGQILVVRYLKSGFTLSNIDILNCDAPNIVGNVKQYEFWNHQISLKIIGNIHDNPELLNPLKGERINTMNTITDPAAKQEEVKEQVTAETLESAAQDAAVGADGEDGAEAAEAEG